MTTTVPKLQQDHSVAIEQTIATFNFERVHCVINALDIRWSHKNRRVCTVPSIAELKAAARSLLEKSIDSKPQAIGGLIANSSKRKDGTYLFKLAFIVTASTNDKGRATTDQ